MLKRLGIVKTKTKGYHVFMDHIAPDFIDNKDKPSKYVKDCWEKYKKAVPKKSNSLNGSVFELIIATVLIKSGITPLFLHANVHFVPNVTYDALLYTEDGGPVAFSIKTSLRERYKQADLEAIALKSVHRKARNYLITRDKQEAKSVSDKIAKGDVLGIDKVLVATDPEFDEFVEKLKGEKFIDPGTIQVIKAANTITEENINDAKSGKNKTKKKQKQKK